MQSCPPQTHTELLSDRSSPFIGRLRASRNHYSNDLFCVHLLGTLILISVPNFWLIHNSYCCWLDFAVPFLSLNSRLARDSFSWLCAIKLNPRQQLFHWNTFFKRKLSRKQARASFHVPWHQTSQLLAHREIFKLETGIAWCTHLYKISASKISVKLFWLGEQDPAGIAAHIVRRKIKSLLLRSTWCHAWRDWLVSKPVQTSRWKQFPT